MTLRRLRTFVALFLAIAANAREAHAARPISPPDTDSSATSRFATPHFVATFDALGVVEGRYGVQVEWLAAPHWGIAAYGWWEHSTSSGTTGVLELDPDYTYSTETQAYGLDTQFRYYFRQAPGKGFFVAPGLEIQQFAIQTQEGCASAYSYDNPGSLECPSFPPSNQNFTYAGLSFDVGAQMILPIGPSGLVIAGSAGIQGRGVIAGALDQSNMPWTWELAEGPGVRPRFRLSVGWAL
ncbi:MAG TPA: hypothetical protein VK841_09605 [Polyangiaceae bacterium]|nr:hypothetical protein [Polyangiaceae bacterium]